MKKAIILALSAALLAGCITIVSAPPAPPKPATTPATVVSTNAP